MDYRLRAAIAILVLSFPVAGSWCQRAILANGQEIVVIRLFQPVYPPIARQANIAGDVRLALELAADGSIKSVNAVSGPLLLQQAALDSAKPSRFERQKCENGTISYQMVFSFQLIGSDSCCRLPDANAHTEDQPVPRVIESGDHVTIVDRAVCICDPAADKVKVRSMKCLYLWKCAVRFL